MWKELNISLPGVTAVEVSIRHLTFPSFRFARKMRSKTSVIPVLTNPCRDRLYHILIRTPRSSPSPYSTSYSLTQLFLIRFVGFHAVLRRRLSDGVGMTSSHVQTRSYVQRLSTPFRMCMMSVVPIHVCNAHTRISIRVVANLSFSHCHTPWSALPASVACAQRPPRRGAVTAG